MINAAAYTHVDRADTEEPLAIMINANAPTEIAASRASIGVSFVHISTDYVFDGAGNSAFRPNYQSQPLWAYGRIKRQGEWGIIAPGGDM